MLSKKQLVEDSFKLAIENVSLPDLLYFSVGKGKELANDYHADSELVTISMCLMDLKLQEAKKKGNIKAHVQMASEFAKEYLKGYDITSEEFDKIINGIEAHHGKITFTCVEAEICANADCYIFIHPRGVFSYLGLLAKRDMNFDAQIKQLEFKLKEKYQLLSLDKAKEELEEYYQTFLTMFHTILDEEIVDKEDV